MNEQAKPEVCMIRFIEDAVKGWKIVVDELTPACMRTFEEASRNLGPHGKKFLAKRIEVSSPEAKKVLEGMGFTSKTD